MGQRLVGVGHGQQIVQAAPIHPGPAEVIGHQRGFDAIDEHAQAFEVAPVERVHGADRQRDTVKGDFIVPPYRLEHAERTAPGIHEVLGHHLEPVHGRPLPEHRVVVLGAQTDAPAQPGPGQGGRPTRGRGGEGHLSSAVSRPPLILRHFSFSSLIQPFPAHSFSPAHE